MRKVSKLLYNYSTILIIIINERTGPEVIKLFRVRILTPNRTHTQEVEVINFFPYSYLSGVQTGDFSSKLHSLFRTVLKTVSAQIIIFNRIYRTEFNIFSNST